MCVVQIFDGQAKSTKVAHALDSVIYFAYQLAKRRISGVKQSDHQNHKTKSIVTKADNIFKPVNKCDGNYFARVNFAAEGEVAALANQAAEGQKKRGNNGRKENAKHQVNARASSRFEAKNYRYEITKPAI